MGQAQNTNTFLFPNLKTEIFRLRSNIVEFSQKLGISDRTLYHKMNGKQEFKLEEMIKIKEIINEELGTDYTLDYLFKKDN